MAVSCANFPDGKFYLGDCLDVMATLPDASVDMVLCDLPYGTTQNKWDAVIPFELLWESYHRLIKPSSVMVLTAAQPFSSFLVMSNVKNFRYEWVWEKEPSGNLNAKKRPMMAHESILIFGGNNYNPQNLVPTLRKRTASDNSKTPNYGAQKQQAYNQTVTGYPTTILSFSKDQNKIHPTQKPVALFEYLIRTYTNAGAEVLDNCAGSGTTAVAAHRTGRNWICIEKDADYFGRALARIYEEPSHAR